MSMLIRKGTMIKSNRSSIKRNSGRRMRSSLKGVSTGSVRSTTSATSGTGSIATLKNDHVAKSSPARSVASTVVSFDDEKQLYQTDIRWKVRRTDQDLDPQYNSICLQISEACKESDHMCDFIDKSYSVLCNKACVTVLVGVSAAVPVSMLSIGVKYINDCPKQRNVPVYLLVGGLFGLLKIASTVWSSIQGRRHENADVFYDGHGGYGATGSRTFRVMNTLLTLFLLTWLVLGSLWVWSEWEPRYEQLLHEPSNWCDRTVYISAVYQLVACYVFLGIIFLCWICLTVYFCLHGR